MCWLLHGKGRHWWSGTTMTNVTAVMHRGILQKLKSASVNEAAHRNFGGCFFDGFCSPLHFIVNHVSHHLSLNVFHLRNQQLSLQQNLAQSRFNRNGFGRHFGTRAYTRTYTTAQYPTLHTQQNMRNLDNFTRTIFLEIKSPSSSSSSSSNN